MFKPEDRILNHLEFLYGADRAAMLWPRLRARLDAFCAQHPALRADVPAPEQRLTERDTILITYGDQIAEPGKPPLHSLAEVLAARTEGAITGVHILPFFPYSSDDGFSVIDYTAVDPACGSWDDVARLGERLRLMFDAVINHISRESAWFQAFLRGDPGFADAFIVVPPGTDLASVTRPRALPLLTPVRTVAGEEKLVWTTFSDDQIDLNYGDPDTLLRIIDVLLTYVAHGAEIIRLDAIAYLWKEIGTSCIHLPQTHRVVQLFRDVLNVAAPGVMLITETNVPHEENVSYFGDGTDEAQLVYQFTLPPLALHAIVTGDATHLSEWAAGLSLPSEQTTFYNFLASHDGIGVRPLEGILPPDEVEMLAERAKAHGGYVSYKINSDGSQSPYELNVSYFDALSNPQGGEPLDVQVRRFMVAQAIMLALQGVPAIYVHSLFGSRNDYAGMEATGRYRSINREKFARAELEVALDDPESLRARVFTAYRHLLEVRIAQPAFHPNGEQRVIALHSALFALARTAPDGSQTLLCLHNVANAPVAVPLDDPALAGRTALHDLLGGQTFPVQQGRCALRLAPYEVLWLA